MWTTLTETTKPEPGFVYRCEEGHEWFIKTADWEAVNFDADGNRKPNNCPHCEEASIIGGSN